MKKQMQKMNMKKLTMILAVTLLGMNVAAQPPKPKGKPASQADTSLHRTDTTPVGTATLLMLGLGVATVGYKVRKNKEK